MAMSHGDCRSLRPSTAGLRHRIPVRRTSLYEDIADPVFETARSNGASHVGVHDVQRAPRATKGQRASAKPLSASACLMWYIEMWRVSGKVRSCASRVQAFGDRVTVLLDDGVPAHIGSEVADHRAGHRRTCVAGTSASGMPAKALFAHVHGEQIDPRSQRLLMPRPHLPQRVHRRRLSAP